MITPGAGWTLGCPWKGACQQLSPTSSAGVLKIWCELHDLSIKNLSPSSFETVSPPIHGQLLPSVDVCVSSPFSASLISPSTSCWLWSLFERHSDSIHLEQHYFSSHLCRFSHVNFATVCLTLGFFLFSEYNKKKKSILSNLCKERKYYFI